MDFRVVEEETVQQSMYQVIVVLESSNREALTTKEAKQAAMAAAVNRGFPAHSLGNTPIPYPVDAAGRTTDDLAFGRIPVKAWRAEYQINASFK